MTNASTTMTSSPGQTRQLCFEKTTDLFVCHTPFSQALDGSGDDRPAGAQLLGQLLRAGVLRNEGAGTVPQLDDSFVLELAVRLRHGIRVNHERLGEGPDARELLAGPQGTRLDA